MTPTLRIASVGWGLLTLFLAFTRFTSLSMLGFPDGYITPYDTATKSLQEVMAWLVVVQATYFLFAGFLGKELQPTRFVLQVLVVVVLVFVPMEVVETCPTWDICTGAYQAMTGELMDDGSGG